MLELLRKELPPTAGLPLTAADFAAAFAGGAKGSFENALATFLQVSDVDVLSSGTLCLSIAFEALKELTGRSRVILPGYTCPLVAIAAHAAGMEILLCDTEKNSCRMDLHILEQICDKSIAAVVPTDIAGLPEDLSELKSIAKSYGTYVIEDAAQALGARLNGRPVGFAADITVFSLAVGKGLSLYDGGILVVNDYELRARVRAVIARRIKKAPLQNLMRQVQLLGLSFLYNPYAMPFVYGDPLRRDLAKGDLLSAVGDHFDFDIPAYEFDELRKRIGLSALRRLPEFVASNRKRALARVGGAGFQPASKTISTGIQVLSESPGTEGSWPFIMCLAQSTEHRDEIMSKLWGSGLGVTRLFISELAGYEYLQKIMPATETPNSRSFASRSFSITNSHWLSDADFEKIVRRAGTIKTSDSELFVGFHG